MGTVYQPLFVVEQPPLTIAIPPNYAPFTFVLESARYATMELVKSRITRTMFVLIGAMFLIGTTYKKPRTVPESVTHPFLKLLSVRQSARFLSVQGGQPPLTQIVPVSDFSRGHEASVCTVLLYEPCVGAIPRQSLTISRQCAAGRRAKMCKCFAHGGVVLFEEFTNGRCVCKLSTFFPHAATWSMFLFCDNISANRRR